MRTLGNILWHFPCFGFVNAIAAYVVGFLLTLTIVAAPVGLGLMQLGKYFFWPFGNALISKNELNLEQNKAWKAYSTVVMVIYVIFIGICYFLITLAQIVALSFTIIGIPLAVVLAKTLFTCLNPVNKKCVPVEVLEEIRRKKAAEYL